MSAIFLDYSSILIGVRRSLHQTQIFHVTSLANQFDLGISGLHLQRAGITGEPPHPLDIYVGSEALNSCPHE